MDMTTADNGAYMAFTDVYSDLLYAIEERMTAARVRYGSFSSTHEAVGVALEEWNELCAAVHANDLPGIEHECLDLAAVLMRLAEGIKTDNMLRSRSIK